MHLIRRVLDDVNYSVSCSSFSRRGALARVTIHRARRILGMGIAVVEFYSFCIITLSGALRQNSLTRLQILRLDARMAVVAAANDRCERGSDFGLMTPRGKAKDYLQRRHYEDIEEFLSGRILPEPYRGEMCD